MTSQGESPVQPTGESKQISGMLPVGREKHRKDHTRRRHNVKKRSGKDFHPGPEVVDSETSDGTSASERANQPMDHEVDYFA